MKKVLIILVLANVAFFLTMRWNSEPGGVTRDAEPLLNEQKIKLLKGSEGDAAKVQPAAETEKIPVKQDPLAATAVQAPVSAPPPAPAIAKQEPLLCLEWGEFSGSELLKAKKVLSEFKLGEKLSQKEVEYETSYWVYMPPLKNRQAVIRKVREIKKLGITEYFAVNAPDKWANAISLGVFKTREAAENHLKHLRTKGIRTAIVGDRGIKLSATWFLLNGVDQEVKARLEARQKDFPTSELLNASCALTKKD
jgi:hypothetical protein